MFDRWSVTASFSLEGVVANELKRMGMQDVVTHNGHVFFRGSIYDAYSANLQLRTADRVYRDMGRFTAKTFDQLFEGVRAIAWEELLPRNANIPVTGKCARSQLMSVRDVQSIVKKAIVERLKQAYKLQWLPEDGPRYAIDAHIHQDEAAIQLDSSGAGLSRRGYRTWNGEAPLRETLAAAMLLLSPWRADRPLLDPMCGTGTIAIEAALRMRNRAPGLRRAFDLTGWREFDASEGEAIKQRLVEEEREPAAPIFAADIDPDALELARRHAQAAGVLKDIRFEQRPLAEQSPSDYPEGLSIVTNPPYGERLGDRKEAEALYRQLGALYRQLPDASLTALTAHPGFERAFGIRATKRRRLFNGRLECELLHFQRGRRK